MTALLCVLAVVQVLLQIADGYTTILALKTGKAHEINPAAIWLKDRLPGEWTWLIVAKLGIIGLCVLSAVLVISSGSSDLAQFWLLCLICLNGWYGKFVFDNVRVYRAVK